MIWESSYWKDDLNKIAVRMRKRKSYKHLYNRSYYLLEKDLYFTFFAIRKLIEVKTKLSTSVSKMVIHLDTFKRRKEVLAHLGNNHKIEVLYDLNKINKQTKTIKQLCNLFIHSCVFNVKINDNRKLNGFMFTSDKTKNQVLYQLNIDQLIDICEMFSVDDVVCNSSFYNKHTGECEYINLNHEQAMKENSEYAAHYKENT